jgi:hypothetical protein
VSIHPVRASGGSSAPFVADYQARSAQAAATLGDRLQTLPGGTLLVADDRPAPLLVFIHGGYWQALSAADSLYLAPGALAAGWSFAAVEYTIAPTGTMNEMVGQCRHALATLGDGLVARAGGVGGALGRAPIWPPWCRSAARTVTDRLAHRAWSAVSSTCGRWCTPR